MKGLGRLRGVVTPARALGALLAVLWIAHAAGALSVDGGVVMGEALVTSTLVIVTAAVIITSYTIKAVDRRTTAARNQERNEVLALVTVERQRAVDEIAARIIAQQQTVLLPVLDRLARGMPTTFVSRPNNVDDHLRWMLTGAMVERTGDIDVDQPGGS